MTRFKGVFTIDADAYLYKPQEVTAESLGDGLWTAACGTYRTVFAEGERSVIAFNTFGTPAMAEAYRDAIAAAVPGKPIETIVQTIDHLDHAGWGRVLAPGAVVVGHELAAAVIDGRGADGQLPVTRIVEGDGERMTIDGVTFALSYPAPTVGSGNLFAHFPAHGVTFGVGPQADAKYGMFPDIHFWHFVPAIRTVMERAPETFVPGRGRVMTRDEAETALDYVWDFQEACQRALVAGWVPIWLAEGMASFLDDELRPKWGHLDGFDEGNLGLGGTRCVDHYYQGGWGVQDSDEPGLLERELRAWREGAAP
jgi:hypothetical protein